MLLARRPYDDVHVLSKRGEEVHEALDGKGPRPVTHQRGDMRLPDAENLSRFRLLQATPFDQLINSQRELSLQ